MNRTLLLIGPVLLFFTSIINAQTYEGNLSFSNQEELDNYSGGYDVINGSLIIGVGGTNDIDNIDNLSEIKTVNGYVQVKSTYLTSLSSLDSLQTINQHLYINLNSNLDQINFQELQYIDGNVEISNNNSLLTIDFPELSTVRYSIFSIGNNLLLESFMINNLSEVQESLFFSLINNSNSHFGLEMVKKAEKG